MLTACGTLNHYLVFSFCAILPYHETDTAHNEVENNECAAGNRHCLLQTIYMHQVQIQLELVEKNTPRGLDTPARVTLALVVGIG